MQSATHSQTEFFVFSGKTKAYSFQASWFFPAPYPPVPEDPAAPPFESLIVDTKVCHNHVSFDRARKRKRLFPMSVPVEVGSPPIIVPVHLLERNQIWFQAINCILIRLHSG
jgi:hypothetical protein